MGNAFTTRRTHARRPPICISEMYKGEHQPGDPAWLWVLRSTLPVIPYPPFDPITVRNLIYHVYPLRKNNEWIRNLQQLRRRLHLFNGKRVVAVATAPNLDHPDFVAAVLGKNVEYLICPNDPRLREVQTFLPLLQAVRSTTNHEATFYAHTKGCSQHHDLNRDTLLAIRYWRNRMYHELLDHYPTIFCALADYAAAGCFKINVSQQTPPLMTSPTGLTSGDWHFAGTYFWFRHDRIFRDPHWSEIGDDPFAAEMWLGKLLDPPEAKSVYQPWPEDNHPHPCLYDPEAHEDPIEA